MSQVEEVLTVTFNTQSPVFPRWLATHKKSPNRGIQHDHLRGEVSDTQDNSQARNIDSYRWWPWTYNPRGQQEYQELLPLLNFELCAEGKPCSGFQRANLVVWTFSTGCWGCSSWWWKLSGWPTHIVREYVTLSVPEENYGKKLKVRRSRSSWSPLRVQYSILREGFCAVTTNYPSQQ